MAQYRQTVLIPLPKQRLSDKDWYSKGQYQARRQTNRRNQEINSILAFFK
jgi:hypothetical protein